MHRYEEDRRDLQGWVWQGDAGLPQRYEFERIQEAQASGRNHLSWEEKFALDVWYVDHCSAWLDFKILARTVRVVLGAEGVSAPSHVTAPDFLGTAGGATAGAAVREKHQTP
jgi:hypothetical protein